MTIRNPCSRCGRRKYGTRPLCSRCRADDGERATGKSRRVMEPRPADWLERIERMRERAERGKALFGE